MLHVNDTKYNPLPIQRRQNRICIFVYCEDMAFCSSKVYNYLVPCKRPTLAVPLTYLHTFILIIHHRSYIQGALTIYGGPQRLDLSEYTFS